MASAGGMDIDGEDEAQEEELARFDDFTLASSWERFISEIEAVCRSWQADGPQNLLEKGAVQLGASLKLYKVKSELKYAAKIYCLEYYFDASNNGKVADWSDTSHDVQLCFGVKNFLLIAPQSASGVVLDAPESSKLLSAVAIALTNCSSLLPVFVPVHDPSRKAYIGIQNMGTIFTRRFEAVRIGSQVPLQLMHLEGLYELFISKFAYSTLDVSPHMFPVYFTMKLTYRTLPNDDDDAGGQADSDNTEFGELVGEGQNKIQWDDNCPWSEWYSAEDPVRGFDLVAIFSEKMVESSMEMAELENASPHDAEGWLLLPKISHDSRGDRVGFAYQLRLLVDALVMSFEAKFMEDFVSVDNHGSDNLKSSMVMPSPTVLDRVLRDLFHEGEQLPNFLKLEHKSSRAIKGAPLGSLFAQFCLHSLWVGNCNVRAIAVLWLEFVREVRWCWEECQPLPHMSASDSIDLSTCLIHQKLQMLAFGIAKKKQSLNETYQDCVGCVDKSHGVAEKNGQIRERSPNRHLSGVEFRGKPESQQPLDGAQESQTTQSDSGNEPKGQQIRKGSSGVVGSLMLLKSEQRMHVPFTQEPPPMTEDMHEERLHAIEAFGDSFSFSAQLEKDILSSDMSAFKAANPNAVFEDFIRWHSPGDWKEDNVQESDSSSNLIVEGMKAHWPPRGRLSKRMSEQGNSWRKIWNSAPALPAYEQKPLLDPNREGEKILHYLETLRPHQLLEQMVCTAFRASANILNQTNFGGLKPMTTKMEQLYLTMVSVLKPLQGNSSGNSEIVDDLRRLCIVFEHIEKLLYVAASLHRKFPQAPRLSEGIFTDYFNYYLPRLGSGSVETEMEFYTKHKVMVRERQVVSNMFTTPTANQSWRKVLSMGNLLNGHEPIVREIIFSLRNNLSGSHYASRTPSGCHDIETHRMYICGTSNDLRVALSVTSCD